MNVTVKSKSGVTVGEDFENNTRLGPGKHSKETDTDRHCFRKSKKGKGPMKCLKCSDYNKGVEQGCCYVCKNNKFEKVLNEFSICHDKNEGVASGECNN